MTAVTVDEKIAVGQRLQASANVAVAEGAVLTAKALLTLAALTAGVPRERVDRMVLGRVRFAEGFRSGAEFARDDVVLFERAPIALGFEARVAAVVFAPMGHLVMMRAYSIVEGV